jgi:phage tail protein
MANWVLFQWGPIQFQVFPMNVNEMSHHTGADWAKKEIAGAAMYREWVGENDEQITLKGRVFPHFFAKAANARKIRQPVLGGGAVMTVSPDEENPVGGLIQQHTGGDYANSGGLTHLDVLDNMRRLGQAHVLIRGDGWHFGWFIIETLNRGHSLIAPDGIGQMIEFEASFQRVPIPNDGASNYGQITGSGGVQNEAAPAPKPPDVFA